MTYDDDRDAGHDADEERPQDPLRAGLREELAEDREQAQPVAMKAPPTVTEQMSPVSER